MKKLDIFTTRIVVESPLAGDFARNRRYAAWCCRAVAIREGAAAWCSQLYAPQFLDDRDEFERAMGMAMTQAFTTDEWEHWHFGDLGFSSGMLAALDKFPSRSHSSHSLASYPAEWDGFQRGEWPPCTPGCEGIQ